MTHMFRVCAGVVVIAAGATSLTSCVSSPTYGTDKTAAEQFLDDLGESIAVGSAKKKKNIAYQPRPGLVVPENGRLALVEPQASLSDRENNPNWIESPEEARQRLLDEADAANAAGRRSPLVRQKATSKKLGVEEQSRSYAERRKAQYGITSGDRRYLSDPPTTYRTVEDPSVLSDLGESEKAKEKRRKKEAEAATSGKKKQWWDPLDLF